MAEPMLELLLAAQINCLAEAVFAESRGENRAGQLYVAAVIKNRVLSPHHESDFCSVINEPWQFSYTHELTEKQIEKRIESEEEAWERAQNVAYSVINSGPQPLFGNILYYHTVEITPNWDYSKIVEVDVVGRHVFYSDKE